MPIPGEYVWQIAGKPIAIHLSLDVVEGISQEVMRGFGAVPRRGAEVGGILLGSLEPGEKRIVRVDDFDPVPIEYKHGPSYLLSNADLANLETSLERLRDRSSQRPVGFFRSHTREGAGLGPEDLDLLNKYFPAPESIALLIRPFATKVSLAGFYFRENGVFQSGPPLLEFPFRRKELDGDATPVQARRILDRSERSPSSPARKEAITIPERPPIEPRVPEPESRADVLFASFMADKTKRGGWAWVPFSFVFLLLGLLLGFLVALNMRPPPGPVPPDPLNLSMSVTKSGDELLVKWDRLAIAIRSSPRGVLTIDDGTFTKTLELDASQLQNGKVVYRNYSNDVRFQLQVFPSARDTLSEAVEWRQ